MLRFALIPLLIAALPATALAEGPAAYDIHEGSTPPEGVRVIATHGTTTAWVDDDSGSVAVRERGVSRALTIPVVDDLDLGPGPTGRTVAVYSRCTPSCDVFYLDLSREDAKEMKVDVAARKGVSERLPTIWRDRIAFSRGGDTYVAPIDNGRAKKVDAGGVDDLELGPNGMLTYAAQFDSDMGNGETGIVALDLDRGGKPRWIDSQVIGEGSAAGFGALTAQEGGLLYARLFRKGCGEPKRKISRYDVRRRRTAEAPSVRAPMAARTASFTIPATPESEGCEDDG